MNGHSHSDDDARSDSSLPRPGTESPLSDVNDLPAAAARTNGAQHQEASEDDAIHDMATSELEEDEEDGEEKDADFDEETPPPEGTNGLRHDGSSSEDDVRSGKRKATVDDEAFMKQNPELYGLRRSVCVCPSQVMLHLANIPITGTCTT